VLHGRIAGTRKQGRPRRRWRDDAKDWIGSTVVEAVRAAQDRTKWRSWVLLALTFSGIFRISVTGGGGEAPLVPRAMGSGGGSWAPPQKKKHFCPQNDAWTQCDAVFNRQKTSTVTRDLEARILRFDHETKFTKIVQNYAKNSRSEQRGSHQRPLNMPLQTFECLPCLHLTRLTQEQKVTGRLRGVYSDTTQLNSTSSWVVSL